MATEQWPGGRMRFSRLGRTCGHSSLSVLKVTNDPPATLAGRIDNGSYWNKTTLRVSDSIPTLIRIR